MSESHENGGRQAGEFTPEESRAHHEGFKTIHSGLHRGLGFDEACAALKVADPEMRRIIVDDYLKVTIAERHFHGGVPVEEVASELKLPAGRIAQAKAVMLEEVGAAAAEAFRRQQEAPPPPEKE